VDDIALWICTLAAYDTAAALCSFARLVKILDAAYCMLNEPTLHIACLQKIE
jgi:hypothetical protein